jgi:hypothetical protein
VFFSAVICKQLLNELCLWRVVSESNCVDILALAYREASSSFFV